MRLQHAQQVQQLQAVHQAEIDRNRNIRQRFEEQLLHQREMNREISDLRLALHQAQTALSLQMKRRTHDAEFEKSRPISDSILTPDRSLASKSLMKRSDSEDKSVLEQATATAERISKCMSTLYEITALKIISFSITTAVLFVFGIVISGSPSSARREIVADENHTLQPATTISYATEDVESVAINARQKLQQLELETEVN